MPKVTIVLPVRNSALHLTEALDSIKSQSFQDWDLLAIHEFDSNDGSLELLEAYRKKEKRIQMVLCNAENVTKGKGLSFKHYKELKSLGIAGISMGNHTFSKKELFDYIDEAERLIVPYNQPKALPGVGSREIVLQGKKIRVTSFLGINFMDGKVQNPFEMIDELLENDTSDIHIIDFHAEATSEKVAMGYFLDGRASAVVGTHTHVPTADERVLAKGTAYITDVGMTGPLDGVIGVERENVINKFITGLPIRFNALEQGAAQLNAVLVDINEKTGKATAIERINLKKESAF